MSASRETLYCDECKRHVPIEHQEDGSIIIHCPKCIGECAVCDCHLAARCFESSSRVLLRLLGPNGEEQNRELSR
jgi:hypothetical protein